MFPASTAFEPHVTIATHLKCNSQDDVDAILTACVAAIRSIKDQLYSSGSGHTHNTVPLVSFNGCSIGKQYFKKVVLTCHENKFLLGLEQVMTELYSSSKSTNSTGFKPHVSLLYSDISPISKAFVRMIEERVEDALDVGLVPVSSSSGDTQIQWSFDREPTLRWGVPGTFKVVRCEGPVDEWEVLGSVDV